MAVGKWRDGVWELILSPSKEQIAKKVLGSE
jgi:hypothetical protein